MDNDTILKTRAWLQTLSLEELNYKAKTEADLEMRSLITDELVRRTQSKPYLPANEEIKKDICKLETKKSGADGKDYVQINQVLDIIGKYSVPAVLTVKLSDDGYNQGVCSACGASVEWYDDNDDGIPPKHCSRCGVAFYKIEE